ncbi:MAG: hypothetical protein ACE5ED_07635 [Rhodothalassiaceae bacterium]
MLRLPAISRLTEARHREAACFRLRPAQAGRFGLSLWLRERTGSILLPTLADNMANGIPTLFESESTYGSQQVAGHG